MLTKSETKAEIRIAVLNLIEGWYDTVDLIGDEERTALKNMPK